MEDAKLAEIVEEVQKVHPQKNDWPGLARKHGYEFMVKVVERLSPEIARFFPKPTDSMKIKSEEGYPLPSLHSDVLWMYGVFLAMYRKNKDSAIQWFKKSMKIDDATGSSGSKD